MASFILPVSGHVDRKAKAIAPFTKRTMVYNCVTLESPDETSTFKTDTILTVGLINNERTFYLKGIDTFIETARLLPGFRFEIVGINQSKLAHKLGNLPLNISLYNKSKTGGAVCLLPESKNLLSALPLRNHSAFQLLRR